MTVAPLTGAWIETKGTVTGFKKRCVAPLTGAWIETNIWVFNRKLTSVAPLTGAWIETYLEDLSVKMWQSHPSRVRGLKHIVKC